MDLTHRQGENIHQYTTYMKLKMKKSMGEKMQRQKRENTEGDQEHERGKDEEIKRF